jgi:type VI secretion system secreted protein VgrG
MAGGYKQDTRVGKLTTPLGDDALLLSRFWAEEEISEVHPYDIEALSTEEDLDFDKALGQNCTLTLETSDGLERHFCGVLVEAELKGARVDLYVYQLELRPWLWLLNHASTTRIFENLTVPDIIKKVFRGRGFSDFRDALTVTYPTLKYCVQYNETDFNFVSRLMQQNGIYYFHEHTDGKHELVVADAKSCHKPAPGVETVSFLSTVKGDRVSEKQGFHRWTKNRKFTTGKVALSAYDYSKPRANLKTDSDKSGSYSKGSLETYYHPGAYTERSEGERLAKVLIDSKKAVDKRRKGYGNIPSLYPGCLVTLSDHPDNAENIEYLVSHCSHRFASQQYRSWSGGVGSSLSAAWSGADGGDAGAPDAGVDDPSDSGASQDYSGAAGMSDSSQPFRAPNNARTPKVSGADFGTVIGNGEIDTDPDGMGRIQVMLNNYQVGSNTFWMRAAQFWAGSNKRGALFLPRVGDEVVVIYQQGDPNQPIVIGSVYNGTNMPPMGLPGDKNYSLIQTRSTPGGDGHQRIGFDDTAGSEKLFFRAQKDLFVDVGNNEIRTVMKDQYESIYGDIRKYTKGNDAETTDGNVSKYVRGIYSLTAVQKITLTVGNSSITIAPDGITIHAPTVTIKGDAHVSING